MTETTNHINNPNDNNQQTEQNQSNSPSIPPPNTSTTTETAAAAPLKSSEISPETLAQLENIKKVLALNLAKKKKLDKELANLEATLYAHETTYLTDPTANLFGNIVKGYEAYVKAPPSTSIGGDHHSTRRKRAYTNFATIGTPSNPIGSTEIVGDAERIFSKSSGSYVRALEIRSKEHESAVTSEQDSIVPLPPTATTSNPPQTEPRKKMKP